MQISNRGLRLIEGFEGFSSCPYWDQFGHVSTRGFGETDFGGNFGGRCISRRQGEENLKRLVDNDYAPAVNDLRVPLNQNQFDALCSFVYNLGPGSMQWNVGQSLRRREYNQAADEMLQYRFAGGVELAGLRTRREEERRLFLTPDGPPPPPPNPLHVLEPDERQAVDAWIRYNKHPHMHQHGLHVIYARMTQMRKNIYIAAKYGKVNGKQVHGGWNVNHRLQRYEILKHYTQHPPR